ncbi:MAG: DUF4386 domain-containing protein [Fulvivirga sp.]|uniref:DUF4386 domain-containing protein n=1 Tax=Fulvivirga sp. TaxID=1931237 RepID=UPI0032EFAE7F
MTNNSDQKELQKQVKIVGFTYLVTTLIGFINNFLIKPGLHNTETLLNSEFQFRVGVMLDFTMYILVFWMTVAFYFLTKTINKNSALLGFVFRSAEAVMGCVIVLLYSAPLVILKKAENYQVSVDMLHSYASGFFDIYSIGSNIHLVLMSIGAFIFISLLVSASYIPKWLGYWGLFTYITVFIGFSLKILLPEFPKSLMLVMAPGALFELTFGIWLLAKGVRVSKG